MSHFRYNFVLFNDTERYVVHAAYRRKTGKLAASRTATIMGIGTHRNLRTGINRCPAIRHKQGQRDLAFCTAWLTSGKSVRPPASPFQAAKRPPVVLGGGTVGHGATTRRHERQPSAVFRRAPQKERHSRWLGKPEEPRGRCMK